MKVTDSNVIRFHLQILYGITVKNFERKRERLFISGAKIFGVPLENVARRYIPEFGLIPWWVATAALRNICCHFGENVEHVLFLSFLVDACSFLLERAGTVGLFRKPGSLPRIKTLRVSWYFISLFLSGIQEETDRVLQRATLMWLLFYWDKSWCILFSG